MIDLIFEDHGELKYTVNLISDTHVVVEFYGKNYKTNVDDYVIIKEIYYKDLLLNELFEHTTMTTDNADYAKLECVDYISFNGVWCLQFTDDDVRSILKRKLT